ncbi:50S ribosomal protein L29 [archaeon HR06]|nr:50S ribosomal protein L29 [archaeon HR06]
MKGLKVKDLRKLGEKDLQAKLLELRNELNNLKAKAERGLIRKESGLIREYRKTIARILTILNERRKGI